MSFFANNYCDWKKENLQKYSISEICCEKKSFKKEVRVVYKFLKYPNKKAESKNKLHAKIKNQNWRTSPQKSQKTEYKQGEKSTNQKKTLYRTSKIKRYDSQLYIKKDLKKKQETVPQ